VTSLQKCYRWPVILRIARLRQQPRILILIIAAGLT